MKKKIPEQYKKKYYLTIFLILPICLIIGFFIGTKVAFSLHFEVDYKAYIFVSFIMVAFYVMGVRVVHRTFLKVLSKEKGFSDN